MGESVRIGAVTGRVEHLTLRRTVIRDLQGALVSIPNGEISQVANLSRDWGQLFVDVALPSDSSTDAALAALERVSGELRMDAAGRLCSWMGRACSASNRLGPPASRCDCSFEQSQGGRTTPRGNCAAGFRIDSSRNIFAGAVCSDGNCGKRVSSLFAKAIELVIDWNSGLLIFSRVRGR